MPNCPQVFPIGCVFNFSPGRTTPITEIVIHSGNSPLEYLDERHKRRISPAPASWATAPAHSSFHFGFGTAGEIHSYVPVADTAWAFGVAAPTRDPGSINLALAVGFPLAGSQCLPGSNWSTDQFNALAREICCLLDEFNLTTSAIKIAEGELIDYPLQDLIQAVTTCMQTSEAPYPIGTSACLPPHATTTDLSSPVAVWDGNCLVALTKQGTATLCTYTTEPTLAAGVMVTSVIISGISYPAPNGGIALDQIVSLTAWLNTLGVGTWDVVMQVPNNVATTTIKLVDSLATSVSVVTSVGTLATTQSDCHPTTTQVPVTAQQMLDVDVQYVDGTLSVNGVVVVSGTPITDLSGTTLGYMLPVA